MPTAATTSSTSALTSAPPPDTDLCIGNADICADVSSADISADSSTDFIDIRAYSSADSDDSCADIVDIRADISADSSADIIDVNADISADSSDISADVADICTRAHAAGAKVVCDNTFLSPALQNPIKLGADFVVHSTTKFINGHSDVVGGAVVSADAEDHQTLAWWANCTGVTGSPFDAYLTLRGVRTLFARIERQQATAARIAEKLDAHPAVRAVHYPGLKSHPNHALVAAQQAGPGAMLSFELSGGVDAVRDLVETLEIFTLAESLGGVESLIAHPATMTHAAMTPEQRATAGIGYGLVRLSVGLEHVEDLIADLFPALDALAPVKAQAA